MEWKVRVGVVGCGYWGSKHLRVLSGMSEVDRVVIIEPDEARRHELAQAFPRAEVASSFADGADLMDAVVIATPARTHPHLARVALQEGKHVLVEKPMATTTAEAFELARLAEQVDRTLMVGHTFEHHQAVRSLRDVVRSGELGDVRYLSSARLNLGLYQSDVNVIWDLAPHDVSILNFVLDAVPLGVNAWGWNHAATEYEDVAHLNLDYGAGVSAQVHVSWLDPHKVRRMTVVGSERMAVYDDLQPVESKLRLFDRGVVAPSAGTGGKFQYRDGEQRSQVFDMREPLLVEDEEFLRCARTGETPSTDARSGLAVTATLEAAQLALRQHRTVSLDEVLASAGVTRDVLVPAGVR